MENKTILVVDDTPINLDIIIKLLDMYNVIDVTNGEDALEIANEEKIDLILLDIMMPIMDGFEVCKKLKENPFTKNIPIIFITGKTDEKSIEKAYDIGGADYVTKPFKPKELLAKVKKELQIVDLIYNLESRIIDEVNKNRQQQIMLFQQSRLAQMGEMLSMIAHQWRQPLNVLSMNASALKMKIKLNKIENKFFIERLENIMSNVQHISTTIDDFRNFFKQNKKKVETTYCEIIRNVFSIVKESLIQKNITIKEDLKCYQKFTTYSNEIKQVVLNLIKNSEDILVEKKIKDAYIKVSTFKDGESYILEVSDNGGGVPEGIIEKVFDPYFSTKLKKDGTGLGLYMSKTIIEEHCGGKLTVSNNKDGAVFRISLI